MNRNGLFLGGIVAAIVIIVALFSLYTVNPREQVLLLQFGAPQRLVTEPGLHVKVPFLQQAQFIPKVLLNLDAPAEEVIAADKKRMVVDAFARWKIVDPLRFYQSLYDETTATMRLTPILSSDVRRVLGSQTFAAMLSGKRAELMVDIRNEINHDADGYGIKIVDVRIRRADLPPQNSQAIYRRMQQERTREANEFRAEGEEISQRVKARAEREVTVLTAEATRESEILRGQGDAEKTKILGAAYGQDPDFFAFYRSLEAYQDAFPGDNTTMILSPNGEFFRYFGAPGRK
ncbi:MAG TPA: protease modulator HflC [Rhizomicrobium sp.]|jgi:membrane protease subunit HflC|nr:protease modulator HflC [Rhizomicrobium sp.]